jgi:hypothetical protein
MISAMKKSGITKLANLPGPFFGLRAGATGLRRFGIVIWVFRFTGFFRVAMVLFAPYAAAVPPF